MLEVRLNLAFLRMTMKHMGTLVKGATLLPTRPVARPVKTTNRTLSPASFRPSLAEPGWDSSSFCLGISHIPAEAEGCSSDPVAE